MALDMLTIPVAIKVPGGVGFGSGNFESEIVLPDIMPDISRILMFEPEVFGVEVEVDNGMVTISGNAYVHVIYASSISEQPVRSVMQVIPFSLDIKVDGVEPGMMVENAVKALITDVKALNARKMLVKLTMESFVRAYESGERSMIGDIDGIEGVQTLRKEKVLPIYAGKVDGSFIVENSYELAASKTPVWELLFSKVSIKNAEMRQSAGYAEINADAVISVMYTEDDEAGGLEIIDFTVPVSGVVRTEELGETSEYKLKTSILSKSLEAAEDETGELKKFNIILEVQAEIEGFDQQEFSMIEDAFAPAMPMKVEKSSIKTEVMKYNTEGGFSISGTIPVEEPFPEVENVITTLGKIKKSQIIADEKKINISGTAEFRVLYNGKEDSGVRGVSYEIPFERDIDVSDAEVDDKLVLKLAIGDCISNALSSNAVDARMDLTYEIKGLAEDEIIFTESVEPVPGEGRDVLDEVIVYMAVGGETPWEVAKKYLVSLEELLGVDGLPIGEELNYGDKVIVCP